MDELQKLKDQGFILKEGIIGGEEVVLIFPAHMGVEWNKDNLIYRSSVWTKSTRYPVSLSWPKFFNWGEKSDLVPEPMSLKDVKIMSKLDGSTLICSKFNGELITRTRGTLDAAQLDNGYEIAILKEKYPKAFNNPFINTELYSVIYEWVSPVNKIILDYGPEPDIFLTGIIRHDDYKILSQDDVDKAAESFGVLRPEQYEFSDIATMIASMKALKGKEGSVVYYNNGQNLKKVKADEYLMLHKFKSNLTPKNMIEMYFQYGQPDYETFMKLIERDFDYENAVASSEIIQQVLQAVNEVEQEMEQIRKQVAPLKDKPRRDAAMFIMQKLGKEKTGLAFSALDDKDIPEAKMKDMILERIKER